MIYFDISILYKARANTGIQRVLKEIIKRFIENNEYCINIIVFNEKVQKFNTIKKSSFLKYLTCENVKTFNFEIESTISIDDIASVDYQKKRNIFFDIDAYWNNHLKRTYLYPKLKQRNIIICNIVHDLVPVMFPYYMEKNTLRNFIINLSATYKYSDITFFPSRSTELDYFNIADKLNINVNGVTRVIKWGSEISNKKILNNLSNDINKLLVSKYILFVGTLEPRKGQQLLLNVFEKITEQHKDVNLVFIGKEGWNNNEFIMKLKQHYLLYKKIFWLDKINDNQLIEFYKHAFLTVYLSDYEGFGLPVAESLAHKNIIITSKNSSIYEVGKDFADYINYNSENELYELINIYLTDDLLYKQKKQFIRNNYKPYSWDSTYNSIITIFNNLTNDQIKIKNKNKKLQFVFISINLNNIEKTITEIDKYINFVKEYIVITRRELVDKFKNIKTKYKIIIINEEELLNELYKDFINKDHVSKNWLLRVSLLNIEELDEEFIMLDDDNRPLVEIDIKHFIENNKYKAYYFYDLLDWSCYITDYDIGQHNMKEVLDKDMMELLSYSSHKPQIINKTLFKEAVNKYFEIGLKKPIDEWSIYFNYAVSNYPHLFRKLKYDTLSWPQHPSNWKQKYIPDNYLFENFYEDNIKGNYKKKINHKKKELEPYLETEKFEEEDKKFYRLFNMVHGVMTFKYKNSNIYIFNIPYFIRAKNKSWKKLHINYKAINLNNKKVSLMYIINKKNGASTELFIQNNYEDRVIEFGISCESLKPGEYDLLIDISIDGIQLFGEKSPYLVKLFVK
ncbi:glycosyltransferase family 4 protein [Hydrogenimonas thermophila]|uniref:Glycosyltransferase involved in cell wall bisynthesis n=1 Tax=Hydrogenimonas thermophila TaxID=223786 RepID=A0A1I5KS83_9BACT|nr:glycosyltransferase family 1 protein [Hydrogenimonas thermophila]SFO87939.1 Glycosyltransferase involved in cell wall bisynthesis [Hydrogenimonas thermophila]